jgi:hypothetical protein
VVAALVALALVASDVSPVALALGLALLVASAAVHLTQFQGVHLSYGAYLGFALTVVLVALAFARGERFALPDYTRVLPVAACLVYVGIVVLPWWRVLTMRSQFVLFPTWTTCAAVVLAIVLLVAWLRAPTDALVALPLLVLALTVVEVVAERHAGWTWGGSIALALGALLLYLGWAERRTGLRSLRVPEVLRVDRL